jgi:hypothetical protein
MKCSGTSGTEAGFVTGVPNAAIAISRTSSSHDPDYMTIELRHEDGRVTKVFMEMEHFAFAVTGSARVRCKVEETPARTGNR